MQNGIPTVCSGTPMSSRSEGYMYRTLSTAGSPARWAASAIRGYFCLASWIIDVSGRMIDARLLLLPR